MTNMFDLTGKRAIVTGAAGELGYAMAEALHECGAVVCILDIIPETEATAAKLGATGPAVYGIHCDVGDKASIDSAVDKAVECMGGLDILINAAGIQHRCKAEEFELEDWNRVIRINLTGTFLMCQKAASIMFDKGGKIINIASMMSYFGGNYIAAYVASKGGVSQLTKALSNEWMEHKINVNAIAPGFMRTKMNAAYFTEPYRELHDIISSRIPAGRWGLASDLQGAAVFLSSPASDYITGHTMPVDGGYVGR